MTRLLGPVPTVIAAPVAPVDKVMGVTLLLVKSATYALVPSVVMSMKLGPVAPMVMAVLTTFVAKVMGETLLLV